jgi:hypothetical protein
MKLQSSVPFAEIVGQKTNPLRGVWSAAKQCQPHGYGWVPKPWHAQTRAEKVEIYRHKHALGRFSDESWKAICSNYPELKGTK